MEGQPYPIIHIRGSAYERGRQHGELARGRVEASVEIYQRAFSQRNGLSWTEACERAAGFGRQIKALDPSILAEMQGIADGAGFRLDEIIAINCRTEILFGARTDVQPESIAHECTTIAVTPSASATGTTIVGKNWDWKAACQASVIILQVEQDDAPNFVMIVEAGMVGRDGFNAAGIAVCGNLLRSVVDGRKPGVPVPMIRRRVLNSSRFDQALDAVLRAERAASTNYLLAHESGTVINCESSPEQVYLLYPERGLLTHSNHFLSVAAQVQAIGISGSDSLYRYQRVRDLLEPKIGNLTVADVKSALCDHFSFPRSVCRHPDEGDANSSMSIASIVMDLGNRTMYVASGPPCCHEYHAVGLPGEHKEGAIHAQHASLTAG